jgi:hypothetical protein
MTSNFRTRARERRKFYIYTQFLLLSHIGHSWVGGEFGGTFYIFCGENYPRTWERMSSRVDSISNITIDAIGVTRLRDKPILNRYISSPGG